MCGLLKFCGDKADDFAVGEFLVDAVAEEQQRVALVRHSPCDVGRRDHLKRGQTPSEK